MDWGDLFFPNFEFTVKFTPNTRDYESRKNIHSWVMLKEFQKRIRVFGKVLFRVSGKIFFRIFWLGMNLVSYDLGYLGRWYRLFSKFDVWYMILFIWQNMISAISIISSISGRVIDTICFRLFGKVWFLLSSKFDVRYMISFI